MHSPPKWGEVKILVKKSVGESQKILILEGVVLWGSIFPVGGVRIFGDNGKLHNHSIKNKYSNLP